MNKYELLTELDELNMYVYDAMLSATEDVELSEDLLKRYRKKFLEIWNNIYKGDDIYVK